MGGALRDSYTIRSGDMILKVKELAIKDLLLIELEKKVDERGFFARSFCKEELKKVGISFEIAQCNLSQNILRGTLRGMHYQKAPWEESKIVTCVRGSIFDVVVDLRPCSPCYLKWASSILDARSFNSLLVPKGCAHGFLSMEDDTVVLYLIDQYFNSEASMGIRYDDPILAIDWPEIAKPIISAKDLSYPLIDRTFLETMDG